MLLLSFDIDFFIKWCGFTVVCCVLFLGCSPSYKDIPEPVVQTLKKMEQPGEWVDAIREFKAGGDSLRLESLYFLLEHMDSHYTFTRDVQTGSFRAEPDIETLTPGEITRHIDLVTDVVRGPLERGEVHMENYLEYILPYRLAWEPVTPWFSEAQERYMSQSADESLNYEPEQLIRMCSIVNDDMKEGFRFGAPPVHARTSTWNQLLQDKTGDCFTMTHLVTYPLRAIGLPVTIDFIPAWGNANGGIHAWNVVMTGNEQFIPFMGCETNPPDYEPFGIVNMERIPPKIFRKTFSSNSRSLSSFMKEGETVPVHLLDEKFIDVTEHYLTTASVELQIGNAVSDDDLVYLSVFSNGNWTPVMWPEERGSYAVFSSMATNMLYLPVLYLSQNQTYPVHPPFILHSDGSKQTLLADENSITDITIYYTQSKAMDELDIFSKGLEGESFSNAIDDVLHDRLRSRPRRDSIYNLHYWDNGWKQAGTAKVNSGLNLEEEVLIFNNVPSGGLYRLADQEHGFQNNRIFTFESGRVVWW